MRFDPARWANKMRPLSKEGLMTRTTTRVLRLVALSLALPSIALAEAPTPKRQMNVPQGPETVFNQPVSEIVPQLAGAKETKRNGRVGGEFVFWGYRLKDGTGAYFYACAAAIGVDCLARRDKICPAPPPKVLSENFSMGNVQRITCKRVCAADQSTAMPCCTGAEESADLEVGLVSCGG